MNVQLQKLDILMIIAMVENSPLQKFRDDDLLQFHADLTTVNTDDCLLADYSRGEVISIKSCIWQITEEFKRRKYVLKNFLQMEKDSPKNLERYLKRQNKERLLSLEQYMEMMFAESELKNKVLNKIRKYAYA